MDVELKDYVSNLCNRLNPEQLADAESLFDNLDVIMDRILEDDHFWVGHIPGLEPHIEMIMQGTTALIQEQTSMGRAKYVLRRQLYMMFMFGYETGKLNWPLKKIPCEEAHT